MSKPLIMTEIFDSINEGIYILNKAGDYIYCNNAFLKMVGATRDEVLTLNAFKLIPQGQVSLSVAVTAFSQKKRLSVVNNVITPKGYRYRQMATATPIFGDDGEIEYMLVETVRLDLLAKRYQQALLNEDTSTIDTREQTENAERPQVDFIAESGPMKALLQTAEQVAKTDSTVLITGETGTGKEVLANFLHRKSLRSDAPLVEINCAALPENLLEAELFGYEKGSFTGALNTGKVGLVESANGGTLFLDEINSLPLPLQGKLLRVLESHRTKRIGAVTEREIDFRLLAATNQNLKDCVVGGTFRADLYYRLNVIPLEIPPLRNRRDDIEPLTLFFLNYYCQRYGRIKVFSRKLMDQFRAYDWPGNVRELKNVVERLLVTSATGTLEISQDLSPFLGTTAAVPEAEPEVYPADWESFYRYDPEHFSLKSYMEFCEKHIISDAVKRCRSSYKAADLLRTDQSTIVRKRKKYNI